MLYKQVTEENKQQLQAELQQQYHTLQQIGLKLDLTCGKPSADELSG